MPASTQGLCREPIKRPREEQSPHTGNDEVKTAELQSVSNVTKQSGSLSPIQKITLSARNAATGLWHSRAGTGGSAAICVTLWAVVTNHPHIHRNRIRMSTNTM
jgi:hypothetical protein